MCADKSHSINRRQFLKLAGSAAAGTLLASCAQQATTVAPTQPEAPKATDTAAPPAPAAVELLYMYPGGVPKDADLVAAELSKTTKDKINATIKLQPIDWGSFEEKIKLASSAGEQIDLEFTAPWINNYAQNIANGNLVVLDDLLTKDAPGLWGSMAPTTWDAARVGGKIYGVINQQIFVKDWGVANLRKDLADKYKIDLTPMKRYEDVEPALKTLKDGEGGTPVIVGQTASSIWWSEYWGFDPVLEIVGNCTLVGVKYDDATRKAINIVDQPEFKQSIELVRKWKLAGYLTDPLQPEEGDAMVRASKGGYIGFHIIKPGGTDETKAKYGFDWIAKGMSPWMLTTAGVTATLNGISRTSKDPDRTMKFLELLNTDANFYNLMCSGIEGKHWVYVDKAKKLIGYPSGITGETSTYHPNTDWMFGCVFNSYYWTEAAAAGNIWDATRKMNAAAKPSSVLGFSFVQDPVKTEMSQITNVVSEKYLPLIEGQVDADKGIPDLQKGLKDAGIDKVIAEVQKQIDAWAASKA
jgi:putative aldouronate transport system substrate-binding protein